VLQDGLHRLVIVVESRHDGHAEDDVGAARRQESQGGGDGD
jgi:hypothetical protein